MKFSLKRLLTTTITVPTTRRKTIVTNEYSIILTHKQSGVDMEFNVYTTIYDDDPEFISDILSDLIIDVVSCREGLEINSDGTLKS